jgi:hypothetical protein
LSERKWENIASSSPKNNTQFVTGRNRPCKCAFCCRQSRFKNRRVDRHERPLRRHNREGILIRVGGSPRPTNDQVPGFLTKSERHSFCIAKNARRTELPTDAPARRGRSPLCRASPGDMRGQPKIWLRKNEPKNFCGRPLKLISVFLIRFLPLLAVLGASCGSGKLNRAPDRCLALGSCAPSYPSCS